MRDRDIFVAVIAVLRTGMAMDGNTLEIAQTDQPRAAGRPTTRALLLTKIGDVRYGYPRREDVPDPDEPTAMIHRETQVYMTTLQINGMAKPPPVEGELDPDEPTASDLANQAAAVMQSDAAIKALAAAGLTISRVRDVRNPKFRNDQDQYEASPSFDLVLTHEQVTVTTTPAAIVGELRLASV